MRGWKRRRKLTVIVRSLLLMTLVASVQAATTFTPIVSGMRSKEFATITDPVGACNVRASAPPATSEPPSLKWYADIEVEASSAVVADIDGDNKPEIIVNSYNVYCLTGTGGIKWTGKISGDGFSTPAVDDIDGDGRQEIVVSGTDWDGRLYCLNWTGGLKWIGPPGASKSGYWFDISSPDVADIDQDGKKEILVGSELYIAGGNVTHPGYLVCLSGSGAVKWAYLAGASVRCRPTAADIEGDGKIEVLFGSESGELCCLNSTGARVWNYTAGGDVRASPVVVDVDGDDKNEVLCSAGHSLYCLNGSGTLKWMYDAATFCLLSSNVTDIDNDGKLEIILGTIGRKVICLGGTSEIRWSYATESGVGGPPIVSDADGDNQLEIIAGTRVVYCLTGSGSLEWTYATGLPIYATPTVADVDSDGRPEIIISTAFRGLYCLSTFPSMSHTALLSLPLIGAGLVAAAVVAIALQARKRRNTLGKRAARHGKASKRSRM